QHDDAGAADAVALRGRGDRGEDDREAARGAEGQQDSLKPLDTVAAIVAAVVWGLTFIAIKYGLEAAPPFLLTALSFTFAAFPLVFFLKPPAAPWRIVALYGLLIGVCQFGLLFVAVHEGMPVGLASLVIQVQVYFTILPAWRWRAWASSPRRVGAMRARGRSC